VKITVIFDVNFKNTNYCMQDKMAKHFLEYLYDMLYIGCDTEDGDPFEIEEAELHLYDIVNVKKLGT